MDVDTRIVDLMEAAKSFIICMASGQTRVLIFTKKKKRPQFHSLLPTSSNMFVHVIRAHLLVMLWTGEVANIGHRKKCSKAGCGMLVILQLFWRRDAATSTLREKIFRRVSRCSILRRDVNVMIKRMVLLILIKYVCCHLAGVGQSR